MIRHKYHADLQHMACQVLNNFAGSAAKAKHLQKKVLAFASGMHERLGAASYVSLLNDLTLGLIADQIMGEVHNHSNLKPVDVDAGNRKLQIMASTTRVLAENADYSKEIAAAGGITSIISAMNNHKGHPYVQHSASLVLRNLADNAENQIKIREAAGSVSSDTCPCPGQRVQVEGLSKAPHYNGLFARVEVRLEGGRYRVAMEQGGKVLSLKADNLVVVPVDLVPVGKDEPSEPRR